MKQFFDFYRRCKESDTSFFLLGIRYIYYYLFQGKCFLLHQRVKLRGSKNINSKDKLEIGFRYVGFIHRTDKTYLNIKGELSILGKFSIGRGCRFDIGENARVTFGRDGAINCNTKIIIMHRLEVGDRCAISWDCQIMDDYYHEYYFKGKKE